MKLKNATQLAIIGIVLQLIPAIMYSLVSLQVLSYFNMETRQENWYLLYLPFISLIGFALLLPFFITLFKSQK